MEHNKANSFVRKVKQDKIRGDFIIYKMSDISFHEISVGSYQYGNIVSRIYISDNFEENTHFFRDTFDESPKNQDIYTELTDLFSSLSLVPGENTYIWEYEDVDDYLVSSVDLLPENKPIGSFTQRISIEENVSPSRSIRANRNT